LVRTALLSRPTAPTLQLYGKDIPVNVAVVSPLTTEGILGLDFQKGQRASINFEREELLLGPGNYPTPATIYPVINFFGAD
jgi:hypothetical protein